METIKGVWEDTKEKISKGIYDDFVKIKDRKKAHVRPHDTKGSKPMMTPQGYGLPRKCFG